MNSKSTKTDEPQRLEAGSADNQMKQEQEQAREKRGSAPGAGTKKERGPFRKWWSEYQKKMNSTFQGSTPETASAN
jgi:hypothetical protein